VGAVQPGSNVVGVGTTGFHVGRIGLSVGFGVACAIPAGVGVRGFQDGIETTGTRFGGCHAGIATLGVDMTMGTSSNTAICGASQPPSSGCGASPPPDPNIALSLALPDANAAVANGLANKAAHRQNRNTFDASLVFIIKPLSFQTRYTILLPMYQ
jgi:hypothetical protein